MEIQDNSTSNQLLVMNSGKEINFEAAKVEIKKYALTNSRQ